MAKNVKAKKNSQKQAVIAGKYGLKFSPEATQHIRKIVEDGEKALHEGRAVKCTLEEIINLTRSL